MKRNPYEFSVFKRLFLLYTLVLVIIYMILVIIFVNNINRSSQALLENKKTQTETYLDFIEGQLNNIYTQEVNLVGNGSVTKLAYQIYEDKYEKNQLVLELMRTIEGIASMNPLIEDIIVTFPAESMTLSVADGYAKRSVDDWNRISVGSEYNYLVTYENQLILNFTYPLMFSVSEDYRPDVNIQVLLSRELLKEGLQVFGDENGNGMALWFRLEEDFVVAGNQENYLQEYVESNSSMATEDFLGIDHFDKHQFIKTGSMKYPLIVIGYIDREEVSKIQWRYIAILTVVMLFISGMFAFSLFYTKQIVVKPVNELIGAFKSIKEGNFEVRIYHESHDEFNYLYGGFNEAVAYIQELIQDIIEQQHLLQNAELAQLQSQINPHFLYNSFFIINRMAKNEEYEPITRFVTSLAKYYRFINKETHQFIPLADEVEHMKNYIDIQQMRFEEKISVDLMDLPEDMAQILVPKLILQPVVENAYNYGMANILSDGWIRIGYKIEKNLLVITIEDNGEEADGNLIQKMLVQLRDESGDNAGHALTNIHRRLKLTYGENCGIQVYIGELGGIKIEMTIDPEGLFEP